VTALRVLVALLAAAAILAGGASMGGAFASPQAPQRREDPGYTGAEGQIGIGDALEVSGQPMQLSLFYTGDPTLKVVGFYGDAFQARGVTPIVAGDAHMAHVSGFDRRDGVQRFITAIAQPDGNTLVMVGLTNPRKPPKLMNAASAASFPVPAENRGFLGFKSEDPGARAESGQYVSSLSTDEVAAFYRAKLPALGWSEKDSSDGLLYFQKPGQTLSVALQKLDAARGAAVFVNRVEGDAR